MDVRTRQCDTIGCESKEAVATEKAGDSLSNEGYNDVLFIKIDVGLGSGYVDVYGHLCQTCREKIKQNIINIIGVDSDARPQKGK